MKVISYIKQNEALMPVEMEVSLTPGLPIIQFLGRADSAIKESEARIRAALLAQDFELPPGHQILINLRPNHIKKSSTGLDLAVAAAILWETEQIPFPQIINPPFHIYGELSLTGEVLAPDDLDELSFSDLVFSEGGELSLFTGSTPQALPFPSWQLKNLNELNAPKKIEARVPENNYRRPMLSPFKLRRDHAKAVMVSAAGEHSLLLAGPAGVGKTTTAKQINSLLRPPSNELWRELLISWKNHPEFNHWRPLRTPHHSTPPISMIGGGVPLRPGEVSRAHGGILLLDELLEFHPTVLDALREPIEARQITLSRANHWHTFPADFLLVATTNLCFCGDYLPTPPHRCRCGVTKRRRYLRRLSGPLLDRFQMLSFVKRPSQQSRMTPSKKETPSAEISIAEISKRVQEAIQFAQNHRQQILPNSRLTEEYFNDAEDSFTTRELLPELGQSRRRNLALLQVARTLADFEQSAKIRPRHIEGASHLTLYSFNQLERADLVA